jgi:hypothetical protein
MIDTSLFSNPKYSLLIILITVFWILPWKIYSLWTAAKRGDKIWFIILAVVNTLGILEIIYVFGVAKKKWSDIKRGFLNLMSTQK